MADRPDWCPDKKCKPLTSAASTDAEKTGSCMGKLAQPTDHGRSKAINDKSWCVMSGNLSRLMVNNDDFEFFIYQMAMACKFDGLPLTFTFLKSSGVIPE